MLVVERNTTSTYWKLGDELHPLEYWGEVVIALDPSKTNFAVIIGTPDGTVLNVLEFSGNNRGRGPVMDTSEFCEEIKQFLSSYLVHANIYCVGLEQTILPKRFKANYHSTMVLTEIRAAVHNLFLHSFGIKLIEVNNWSWKAAILPEGYRSISEKGSKKWFLNTMPDSPYSKYFEADVTDALCIYWYLLKSYCNGYSLFCNRREKPYSGFQYTFVPQDSGACKDLRVVLFNNKFSLDENLAFYTNRILGVFCMELDMVDIPINSVYGHAMLFSVKNLNDTKARVVVKRVC